MSYIESMKVDEVDAKALQAAGLVVLDFYQATCAPCRALEPRLERVVSHYRERLRVYRIDIDRDLSAAERFGVQSIPTILILRDGKEIERLDGLITEHDLQTAFNRALGGSV
jgi:thioredoxin 1